MRRQRFEELSTLEQLPNELLDKIYGGLPASKVKQFQFRRYHPLSRRLRPYAEEVHYREFQISYPRFLRLCVAIQGSPHLVKYIKELTIDDSTEIAYDASGRQIYDFDRVTPDYKVGDESAVFRFFCTATSLEKLDPQKLPRLQQRLLSARFTMSCYKALKSLTLGFDDSHTFLDKIRFLPFIDQLQHLHMHVTPEEVRDEEAPMPVAFTTEETKYFMKEDESSLGDIDEGESFRAETAS